jgi:peroxiredoxin
MSKLSGVPVVPVSLSVSLLACIALLGCREKAPGPPSPSSALSAPSPSSAPSTQPSTAASTPALTPQGATPLSSAKVGEPAPDFELNDLDGHPVRLHDFRGKVVVLEWFNPECPFVRASHTQGSLVDTALRLTRQGVVYLAINSGGPGKQGYGTLANQQGVERFQLKHPVLLDESGRVGHAYGATNTPHTFVINAAGVLVYRGAVDNSPDGEGQSPEGGRLVRYMEDAVTATLNGKAVTPAETKAYGCSVKYGS